MPSWRWLDFVTTFQNNLAVIKQQIVKNISTNHEILTVPSFQHNFILYRNDINIFVSRISHWTQYSGYSWYFLCSSWNTDMKHMHCTVHSVTSKYQQVLHILNYNATVSHPCAAPISRGIRESKTWNASSQESWMNSNIKAV